jgi:eukaryotic-like serine/threonine-protein kinase
MTGEYIGRYRVVRPLASGGMGEVYEGFDGQLQRPVAIKGLLGDPATPERRERLRREALSIAAVSHPAIAHVYEIIADGDRDWVVMEYIDGRPLSEVVREGPLPAAEVARIGEEIAGALAAAHGHGIIHRDIKTDNVMLTRDGHVKVLDFGLAMWTGPRRIASDRLTAEGNVVGTARAMSPEQARGRDVDERSDVFSLGSLLYELASGASPFQGINPTETMVKVANAEHVPLRRAAPAVPRALAEVVEACLQRDPGERPASAAELATRLHLLAASGTVPTAQLPAVWASGVARRARTYWWVGALVVALGTALTILAVRQGWLSAKRSLVVAVLPVSAQAPGDAARLASAAVSDAISSKLAQLEDVVVVSGREVRGVAQGNRRPTEIARELGADELVEASLTQGKAGEPARIVLARLDGSTGRVTWTEELDTATDDLLLLEDRITTALADGYRGFSRSATATPREATPEALHAYLEVKARLDAGRGSKDYAEEIALLQRAVTLSPRFLEPMLWLASIHRYLFELTRASEQRDACRELLARASRLAPKDPRVMTYQIDFLLATGAKERALEVARVLAQQRPGDAAAWAELGDSLAKLGRFSEAERAFARSYALRPYWSTLYALANARIAHGDNDGAGEVLRQILERNPDNLIVTSKLAEVEMYAGNYPESERLYRAMVARRGTNMDMMNLGTVLFFENRFEEAADLYRKAEEKAPEDPSPPSNVGEALLRLGKPAEAKASFQRALALADKQLASGSRTRSLLNVRARALAYLGRGPEAVLAAQEGLREYPDNPDTVFVAALVAAITGDETSCMAWTQKALELHAPKAWFSGPEFDRLRANPQFAALFSASR